MNFLTEYNNHRINNITNIISAHHKYVDKTSQTFQDNSVVVPDVTFQDNSWIISHILVQVHTSMARTILDHKTVQRKIINIFILFLTILVNYQI